MKLKDLINAEREGVEEPVIEQASAPEDFNDDMFCTAAGATNLRPSGKSKSMLRALLNSADRA